MASSVERYALVREASNWLGENTEEVEEMLTHPRVGRRNASDGRISE